MSSTLPNILSHPLKRCQTYTYESVPGFFIQDDPATNPSNVGSLPPHFGLNIIGAGSPTSGSSSWAELRKKVTALQKNAPKGTLYKVVWFGRHGQGWHNVAELIYGTPSWKSKWSLLNGDGNITWGPDAKLSQTGIEQAQAANALWKKELSLGPGDDDAIPIPTKLFSSPLSRAASTLEITFGDFLLRDAKGNGEGKVPLIMENLREVTGIYGCDQRDTRSYLRHTYPNFDIEEGFTEEDDLFSPDVHETDDLVTARLKSALDSIFGLLTKEEDTYISITSHAGAIRSALSVIGHRIYYLPTGGVIPVLVKATPT